MASVAQIQANRLNAQKSTGPRTAQGKAVASQNAVKHGLLAEQVVIHGEDPAQFDLYRDQMLADLAPVGGIEMMLAERAVGLAWRLRRAERLHSAVFATVYRENAGDIVLWPRHGLPIEPKPDEEAVILGHVVMTDFARAQILDRLLVHERRIENSLYRTMRELRKEQEARMAAGPEPSLGEEPRSNATEGTEGHREKPGQEGKNAVTCGPLVCSPGSCLPASVPSVAKTPLLSSDRQTCPAAELASFGEEVSSEQGPVSGDGSDFTLGTSHLKLASASCETNPIAGDVSHWALHSHESAARQGTEGAF